MSKVQSDLLLVSLVCSLAVAAGCAGDTLDYTETKRIDEKVTETELQTFLRIIDSLPEQKLPQIPPVFAPPPEWNQARTLPVNELVNEESNLIEERSSAEFLARQLQRNRPLQRALRREQMTPEQFVGLSLAIGVALARNTLRDNQDLGKILAKGEAAIDRLKNDNRPFSSLRQEAMYYVLKQAVWITRVDRVNRLQLIPPENLALVRKHRDVLDSIFPVQFNSNPLDAVADLLEEQGLPFEELSDSGSDEHIVWNPNEAQIGLDNPDEESRAKSE